MELHKADYEKARASFQILVSEVLKELVQIEPSFTSLEPKDYIFRIYRDIRFSKDKTPYKNHFGAYFAEGGRKSTKGGYYLHIEPGGKSMIAGGIYMPPTEDLKKIRQEIDYNGQELHKIMGNKAFRKYFGGISGDKLKKTPKDYSADHPDIELLRLKDFTAVHKIADEKITEDGFAPYVIEVWKALKPLNDFLNTAISQ